jgi:hypothetical protein
MNKLNYLVALICIVMLAACSSAEKHSETDKKPVVNPNPVDVEAIRKLANTIDLNLENYQQVNGQMAMGEKVVQFSAFFAGDSLKTIVATEKKDGAVTESQIYYQDEKPVLYKSTTSQSQQNRSMQLIWDKTGNLVRSEAQTGADVVALADDTAKARYQFAELLRQTAHQQLMMNQRPH